MQIQACKLIKVIYPQKHLAENFTTFAQFLLSSQVDVHKLSQRTVKWSTCFSNLDHTSSNIHIIIILYLIPHICLYCTKLIEKLKTRSKYISFFGGWIARSIIMGRLMRKGTHATSASTKWRKLWSKCHKYACWRACHKSAVTLWCLDIFSSGFLRWFLR